jgi:hypothetical protein
MFLKAKELGLVTHDVAPTAKWTVNDYFEALQDSVIRAEGHAPRSLPTGSTVEAIDALLRLREQEDMTASELSKLKASFLMIDQPSQVYFPEKLAIDHGENQETPPPSVDIVALQRIFRCMEDAVNRTHQRLRTYEN